ncbi:MAG: Hsp20/alpha crystallin family protein [Thiogranum sp.]
MSTFAEIGEGLERAWDSIADGWRQLRQRAAHALTRFKPLSGEGKLETAEEVFLQRSSRWGLLAADVSESDAEVNVRLEAPGLEADNLDIHVVGNVLVVRGEKKVQRAQTEGRFYVMECAYGSFERAVPLPVEVDESAAKASYRRGVLHIKLPKKAAARARRIEVQY